MEGDISQYDLEIQKEDINESEYANVQTTDKVMDFVIIKHPLKRGHLLVSYPVFRQPMPLLQFFPS